LRGSIGVRLAAGENEFGAQGFGELMDGRCVDIVQPDASRCGGLTPTIAVAQRAKEVGLEFAPHTWSDAVTVVANAHVVAAFGGLTVEIDQTGNANIETVITRPLAVTDGLLELGDGPGLGIALDEAAVSKLMMADPLKVPDGNYSDMVFGAEHWTPAGAYA
jgi:L-alanine-DL-glutamate epimerase-like enolase superfamily enzyme